MCCEAWISLHQYFCGDGILLNVEELQSSDAKEKQKRMILLYYFVAVVFLINIFLYSSF